MKVAKLSKGQVGMKGRYKEAHVSSLGRFRGRRSPRGGGGEGKMAGLAAVVRLIKWLARGEGRRASGVLTCKPEGGRGGRGGRGGGKDGLQRSMRFGVEDPEVDSLRWGEDLGREQDGLHIHRLFKFIRRLRLPEESNDKGDHD